MKFFYPESIKKQVMFKFFIKYYLPAIIWAGIIFYFSSLPGLGYSPDPTKETILRKGAHFFEYAGLAFLVWRIFYVGHKIVIRKSFWLSFFIILFYAVSDEVHQSFVTDRTGKVADVFYDALSALIILESMLVFTLKKKTTKIITYLFFTIFALIFLEYKMVKDVSEPEDLPLGAIIFPEDKVEVKKIVQDEQKKENTSANKNISQEIFIQVPFTSQAPFAVWDEFHEEACEEASLVMLKYYLAGQKLSTSEAEKEIQDLIKFQNKNYGDYKDTTAAETITLAKDFYKINNLKAVYDFKKDDLKKYLARKQPIIIPAAGRLLGNPFFTQPGPLYHNLVLVGYDGDKIITNDPGTKRGESYKYDIDILYNAIHDFPGRPEDIEKGKKAMIVVE